MSKRVEIVSEVTLYRGWSWLRKYVIDYTRSDGRKELQSLEIYNSGDGAAILLYNPAAREIVLIKQFRLPVMLNSDTDGFIIECCAGMLDDLNPEQAIIKEVREETGYEVKDIHKIYEAFATPGAHMEKIHFYTAAYNAADKVARGGGESSEQEDIEVLHISYNDIANLLRQGNIIDAKTIVLLQYALIHLV